MSESFEVICVCKVCPVVPRLVVRVDMSLSLLVIWVCRVCPEVPKFVETVLMLVVRVCPVVIKLDALATTSPSTARGKFNSNLSLASLYKMFALVAVPRSITIPPEILLIPALLSPLLISIILSLTARFSTSTTTSVPVTVKLFIVTSLVNILFGRTEHVASV